MLNFKYLTSKFAYISLWHAKYACFFRTVKVQELDQCILIFCALYHNDKFILKKVNIFKQDIRCTIICDNQDFLLLTNIFTKKKIIKKNNITHFKLTDNGLIRYKDHIIFVKKRHNDKVRKYFFFYTWHSVYHNVWYLRL